MSNVDGQQTTPNIQVGNLKGIFNGLAPRGRRDPVTGDYAPGHPKGLKMTVDFTELSSAKGKLLFGEHAGLLEFCQSVFVNNRLNLNPLLILIDGGFQTLEIPAQSQGEFPVYSANPLEFEMLTPAAAELFIDVTWKNVPGAFTPWGPISIGNVNATLVPTIAAAVNNFSVAATGASQLLVPANANRKRLFFGNAAQNNDPMAFDYNAAAAFATGIVLIPGGQEDSQFGPIYQGDIFAIGTAGEIITAKEWV